MNMFMFAGSLRAGSTNKKLASLIAGKLEARQVEVDLEDFRSFDIPLYDGELQEEEGIPDGVRALGDRILANARSLRIA